MLWDNWGEHIERDDYFIKKIYSTSNDLKRTRQLLTRIAPQILDQVFYVGQVFPCKKVIEELDTKFFLAHFDIYDKIAFESGIGIIWPMIHKGGCFIVSAYG